MIPLFEDSDFRYGVMVARKLKRFYKALIYLPHSRVMMSHRSLARSLEGRERTLKHFYPERWKRFREFRKN